MDDTKHLAWEHFNKENPVRFGQSWCTQIDAKVG